MGTPIDSLAFILVAAGAVWFIYGPWQIYCEDSARQDLFDARNVIFDLAADGKLSFESPEYKEIRSDLNCFIRYAHHVSLPRLVAYFLFMPKPENVTGFEELIAKIQDEETRSRVELEILKATRALFLLLIHRSPLLWPMLVLPIIVRNVFVVRSLRERIIHKMHENAVTYCRA